MWAVALLTTAFVIGVPIVWFASSASGKRLRGVIGAVAALACVACAALAWPVAVNRVTPAILSGGHGLGTIAEITNSNVVAFVTVLAFVYVPLTTAAGYLLIMKRVFGVEGPWKRTAEYAYAVLMVPTVVWMLIASVLLAPVTLAHPLRNAFSHWPMPDPSAVAVLACASIVGVGLFRWAKRDHRLFSDRHLTGAVALSALAFVPFLVPAAFRSGGRFALAGITIVLIFAVGTVVVLRLPVAGSRRGVTWQLGAAALTVPLLAYTDVSAGYTPALVGGTLADIGHNVGPSPFSHLRLLIVVPVAVGLLLADRDVPRLGLKAPGRSHWRDFEADVLMLGVRDGDLADLLPVPLTRYLHRLDGGQQRSVALSLARALGRRYRVRRVSATTPVVSQVSRLELNHAFEVASRALSGDVARDEMHTAVATAVRIEASAGAVTGAAREIRHRLAATLEIALGDGDVSVDALVDAVMAEVTAIGRNYLALEKKEGAASDRAIELYRSKLARLRELLHGKFMLFQDPEGLSLASALVLDEPERERWGLIQPYKRPYIYIAAVVALIAVITVLMYFLAVVELRVLPQILSTHR